MLVPSRVIGEGLGASTQSARSVPIPSMLMASSSRSSLRARIEDTTPLARSIARLGQPAAVIVAPRGRGRSSRRESYAGQLGQRHQRRRQHRHLAAARGRRRASAGRTHATRSDSVLTSRVRCPCGKRGDEEPRVVAAFLDLRGDPVRPGAQQVGAEHEPAPGEQLGQRLRPVEQRLPVGLPVVAAGVRHDRVLGRPGEQHAGLLERLAYGGADQLAGERLGGAEGRRPTRPGTARTTPTARSPSRGSTEPPGKTYAPGANFIDDTRRSR